MLRQITLRLDGTFKQSVGNLLKTLYDLSLRWKARTLRNSGYPVCFATLAEFLQFYFDKCYR